MVAQLEGVERPAAHDGRAEGGAAPGQTQLAGRRARLRLDADAVEARGQGGVELALPGVLQVQAVLAADLHAGRAGLSQQVEGVLAELRDQQRALPDGEERR